MLEWLSKLLFGDSLSGVKVGDIDIGDQVIDSEYRIRLLFRIIQTIMAKNPQLKGVLQAELDQWKKEIEKELQDKYPNSGIKIT